MAARHPVAQERAPPAFVFRLLSSVLPTKKELGDMKKPMMIGCVAALGAFAALAAAASSCGKRRSGL